MKQRICSLVMRRQATVSRAIVSTCLRLVAVGSLEVTSGQGPARIDRAAVPFVTKYRGSGGASTGTRGLRSRE